jgi:siroheme synthase
MLNPFQLYIALRELANPAIIIIGEVVAHRERLMDIRRQVTIQMEP